LVVPVTYPDPKGTGIEKGQRLKTPAAGVAWQSELKESKRWFRLRGFPGNGLVFDPASRSTSRLTSDKIYKNR
jgi:hypothetical protein